MKDRKCKKGDEFSPGKFIIYLAIISKQKDILKCLFKLSTIVINMKKR